MSDDIVNRLEALLSKCNTAPAMAVWSRDLRDAANEISKLRAEIVDRACGFTGDVNWEPKSPTRAMAEDYARGRGWPTLFDRINTIERVFRETGRLP